MDSNVSKMSQMWAKVANASVKKKVAVGGTVAALVLGGVGVGAYVSHQKMLNDCAAATEDVSRVVSSAQSQVSDAKSLRESLNVSTPEADPKRLYLSGFVGANQDLVDKFDAAVSSVEKSVGAVPKDLKCASSSDLDKVRSLGADVSKNLEGLDASVKQMNSTVDAFREQSAIADATKKMGAAKKSLVAAQKSAEGVLAKVGGDAKFANEVGREVVAALKKSLELSRSLSVDVTAKSFDEALVMLDKAAKLDAAVADLQSKQGAAQAKFKAYRDEVAAKEAAAKAAAAAKARSTYRSGSGSSVKGYTSKRYTPKKRSGGSSSKSSGDDGWGGAPINGVVTIPTAPDHKPARAPRCGEGIPDKPECH